MAAASANWSSGSAAELAMGTALQVHMLQHGRCGTFAAAEPAGNRALISAVALRSCQNTASWVLIHASGRSMGSANTSVNRARISREIIR